MRAALLEGARYAAMALAGYMLVWLGPIGAVLAVACGGVIGLGALQFARERRVLLEQRAAEGGTPRTLLEASVGEAVTIEGVLRGEPVATPLCPEPTHAIAVLTCRSGTTTAGDAETPLASEVLASPLLRIEAEGGEAWLAIEPVFVFGTVTAQSQWAGLPGAAEPAVGEWLDGRLAKHPAQLSTAAAMGGATEAAYDYQEVTLEPGDTVRVVGEVLDREEQQQASGYRETRAHVQLTLGPSAGAPLRIDGWTRAQERANRIAHAQLVRLAAASLIWAIVVAALSV